VHTRVLIMTDILHIDDILGEIFSRLPQADWLQVGRTSKYHYEYYRRLVKEIPTDVILTKQNFLNGDLELIKKNDLPGRQALKWACQSGYDNIVDWVITQGYCNWIDGIKGACIGGNFKWVTNLIGKVPLEHMGIFLCEAAKGNSSQIFQWLTDYAVARGFKCGRLTYQKIVYWLAAHNNTDYDKTIVTAGLPYYKGVCRSGDTGRISVILQSVTGKDASEWGEMLAAACESGNLEAVKLIWDEIDRRRIQLRLEDSLTVVYKKGYVNLIDFITTEAQKSHISLSVSEDDLTNACKGGHIGLVRTLIDKYPYLISDLTLKAALRSRNRELITLVFQATLDQNDDPDSQEEYRNVLLINAMIDGYSSIVKEILDLGEVDFEPSISAVLSTAVVGHLNVIKYLAETGRFTKSHYRNILVGAAVGINRKLMRYLLTLPEITTRYISYAIRASTIIVIDPEIMAMLKDKLWVDNDDDDYEIDFVMLAMLNDIIRVNTGRIIKTACMVNRTHR